MEYASVYALQNWARKDPAGDIEYNNLELLRAFESHEGSEKGFMRVYSLLLSYQRLFSRRNPQTRACRYGPWSDQIFPYSFLADDFTCIRLPTLAN